MNIRDGTKTVFTNGPVKHFASIDLAKIPRRESRNGSAYEVEILKSWSYSDDVDPENAEGERYQITRRFVREKTTVRRS